MIGPRGFPVGAARWALALFFSPRGRISPRAFWLGFWAVLAASVALWSASLAVQTYVAYAALMGLYYLLFYPAFCVYGKRFHDAGRSAWLYLVVFGVKYIAGYVVNAVLVFASVHAARGEARGLGAMMGWMLERLLALELLANVLIAIAIAHVVANMKSDLEINRHGPQPGKTFADEFS